MAAGAKVVMVGDPRQLGAVAPGGGFESLVARFGGAVHFLGENVRQVDYAERMALHHLRAGDVGKAVALACPPRPPTLPPAHRCGRVSTGTGVSRNQLRRGATY